MESLGRVLKQKRAARGITQTIAARESGIEQSYLSKLESDQAWASLEVLQRICRTYRTDVRTLLGQVDQDSLRGNLQYQGFLQRQEDRIRRTWISASAISVVACAMFLAITLAPERSPPNLPHHTPVSLQLEGIEGRTALGMIADYGGLTIKGLDSVEGRIDYLEAREQPWDVCLAMVAAALGYRVEITGSVVDLIPIPEISGQGQFDAHS